MYLEYKVKIPDVKGKIYRNKLKITYINYEYDRVYKPEKIQHSKANYDWKLCEDSPDA